MTRISTLPLVFLLGVTAVHSKFDYSNVKLSSLGGDLSVTVFLPKSIYPEKKAFYQTSRFEHGSMIGNIHTKSASSEHNLYGDDLWRTPHNRYWPEAGVGLASEFGAGEDGAFCTFKCGWNGEEGVSNGVLGYAEARHGEPFLKIGVGSLIKGSCQACDSSEDFKYNSPYYFFEEPKWTLHEHSADSITLEHEAMVRGKKEIFGYRLGKEISLEQNVLSVTSTLTNLGDKAFSTPWYSQHLFTCDSRGIGRGYEVDLKIHKVDEDIFDEPGAWSWTSLLKDYATITPTKDSIKIDMKRGVPAGVFLKAEFPKDGATGGAFTINACGTSLTEEIPEVLATNNVDMYGYNLYIEEFSLSPTPLLLIHLDPGTSTTWTQRITVAPEKKPLSKMAMAVSISVVKDVPGYRFVMVGSFLFFVWSCTIVAVKLMTMIDRKSDYTEIAPVESEIE